MKKFLAIFLLAASTVAVAQTNSCPTCDGQVAVTYTGTANAALPADTVAWEAMVPITNSYTISPAAAPATGIVARNCTGAVCQETIMPYPPNSCAYGITWNGKTYSCLAPTGSGGVGPQGPPGPPGAPGAQGPAGPAGFFSVAPPTNCKLGVNWNGKTWTCVSFGAFVDEAKAEGYTVPTPISELHGPGTPEPLPPPDSFSPGAGARSLPVAEEACQIDGSGKRYPCLPFRTDAQ